MFREMRRNKQQLSMEESIAVLKRGTSGVLAVSGDDGYPYAVPVSYVYYDSKLYFHCAKTGHKIDAITKNNKVSFCVIDQDEIVAEESTTYYRSVIVFGKARFLETEEEKRKVIEHLNGKYSQDEEKGRQQASSQDCAAVCVVEIEVDHITGKEALELVRDRE